MYSSGYLLLEHSEFPSNYVGSFQELRNAGELFDVTLACEDETVEAHKVVISACSPFFRHVLSKTKQNHPFIYLKGVLHQDLLALLDYIYTGETKVATEDVNRFIEAAQELKIKGLAEQENSMIESSISLNCSENNLQENSRKTQKDFEHPTDILDVDVNDENIKEDKLVKNEVIKQEIDAKAIKEESYLSESFETEDDSEDWSEVDKVILANKLEHEISKRIEKVMSSEGKLWKCTECGKIRKRKDNLKLHVETHLKGFSRHTCNICDRTFKTRNSKAMHISVTHRGVSK